MPTIPELVTATETKLADLDTQRATLQAQIDARLQQLADAERRRAVLKTRLEALRVLAQEP